MTTPLAAAAPRRTLATRNSRWARILAARLAAARVRPNSVSIAGVVFAGMSAVTFYISAGSATEIRAALLLVSAACIQLRLLCNLLDGMLAVECGLQTPTGEIFNELPDRVADVMILAAAGYAARELPTAPILGWAAAVAALFTAYVRVLGGALGLRQHFIGPMAKQHRMFVLTVAAMLAAVEILTSGTARAIPAALAVILAGSMLTAMRRLHRVAAEAGAR
jgi:phosphatidylglycerophosphate synthase